VSFAWSYTTCVGSHVDGMGFINSSEIKLQSKSQRLDGPLKEWTPRQFHYLSVIIGSLLHIANFTRPDAAYAAGVLARWFSSNYEASSHVRAAKRAVGSILASYYSHCHHALTLEMGEGFSEEYISCLGSWLPPPRLKGCLIWRRYFNQT